MTETASEMRSFLFARPLRMRPQFVVIAFLALVIAISWLLTSYSTILIDIRGSHVARLHRTFDFTNEFNIQNELRDVCYHSEEPKNIEDLVQFINILKRGKDEVCLELYEAFSNIYRIRQKYTSIKITPLFKFKMQKWLNNDEHLINSAKNQSIIFVDNLFSQESVVFNPVRAHRPGTGNSNTRAYVNNIISKSSTDCDFCNYKNSTATDYFGYLESKEAVVVSNTFKIDRFHGMVLLRSHDPLQFTQLQYIDSMNLAMQWFRRVHQLAPSHRYRFMYTDMLPKASASQVHPHTHLALGDSQYYSKWNILHEAAERFSMQHNGKNYWTQVLKVHSALGLAVRFGSASVMAYLTPQKDYEVLIISQKPCLDFFRLVFFTLRTFIDDLEQYALSTGYVFPKLGSINEYGDELPMMSRIVSRGPADNPRSDVSSFDLFGTPNVNTDPFKVIQAIQKTLDNRSKVNFSYPLWNNLG